jgi:hypothetical protein
MKKQSGSLKYWKAQCRADQEIPVQAIMDHKLTRWFMFMPAKRQHYALVFAEATGKVVTEWQWVEEKTGEKDLDFIYRRDVSGALLKYPRMGDG